MLAVRAVETAVCTAPNSAHPDVLHVAEALRPAPVVRGRRLPCIERLRRSSLAAAVVTLALFGFVAPGAQEVSTIAGTGVQGFSGDSGPAVAATSAY